MIEQVEVAPERFERWTLRAHVKGRNKLDSTDTSPALDVKIEADKILNVTVTKSFLSLLNQLSEVFAQAAKQISPPSSRALPGTSQFVLRNETGLPVKILDSESISVFGQSNEATHGSYVNLNMKQQGANRTVSLVPVTQRLMTFPADCPKLSSHQSRRTASSVETRHCG